MAVSPVMESVHGPPTAQPSVVLVASAVVGFGLTSQTIPLTVTVELPFDTMVPPLDAVVEVMPVTALVVTLGIVAGAHEFEFSTQSVPLLRQV